MQHCSLTTRHARIKSSSSHSFLPTSPPVTVRRTFLRIRDQRSLGFLVFLGSIDKISSTSVLPLAINNTLTALYHAIRLDLGVIRPNQIYNLPAQFNASIVDVGSGSHKARAARDAINPVDLSSSTYSVHVPDILYLTPVFKLKPISQAITAVFVSAFSMLTAIWALFNFVASALVTRSHKNGLGLVFVCLILC
jgi:hypothetical protein